MIIETAIVVVTLLVGFLLQMLFSLVPAVVIDGVSFSVLRDLMSVAFAFVPFNVFMLFINTIIFWYIARLSYAVLEWVIKKIPFIGIS